MSIASRARNEKRPSPESGRPRLRNAKPEKPAPFNFTEFVKGAHEAAVRSSKVVLPRVISGKPTPGAFGAGTKATRAARLATKPQRIAEAIEARKAAKARKAAQKGK